jgi:ribose-phosphate pyrophosphokinase
MKLVAGTANPELAQELSARLGVPLMPVKIGSFNDGEVAIQLMENVRNSEVYIIQPTSMPVNDNLMQLLLLISACRRASASRVIAIVPYYGYARQDRKERSRVPISAADVAKLMESMGVDRVCCVDLHCGQIQGFFGPRTPVDNLWASTIALQYFKSRVDADNVVVVSPDAGGVARAKLFKDGLEAVDMHPTLAVIIKQRVKAGEVGQTDLVGSVRDCDVIIVDDMIDTAGTLCAAANELKQFGAKRVFAFATHGLFNNPAAERIEKSALEEVVTSNTIPLRDEVIQMTKKIRQVRATRRAAAAPQQARTHARAKAAGVYSTERGEHNTHPSNLRRAPERRPPAIARTPAHLRCQPAHCHRAPTESRSLRGLRVRSSPSASSWPRPSSASTRARA